jgi:hypothetical protein
VGASAVESTAVRSRRPAASESSSDRPIPRPCQDGSTCSSAISKESSSHAHGASSSPNPATEMPAPARVASAAATMSCHHWPFSPWKP